MKNIREDIMQQTNPFPYRNIEERCTQSVYQRVDREVWDPVHDLLYIEVERILEFTLEEMFE